MVLQREGVRLHRRAMPVWMADERLQETHVEHLDGPRSMVVGHKIR